MKRKPPADSTGNRDPYKPARRPAGADRGPAPYRGRSSDDAPPGRGYGRSRGDSDARPRPAYGGRSGDDEGGRGYRPRSSESGGFTVVLDPDVARVFRGAASVNKALRLVMQLNQVVQGPPPRAGGPRQRSEGGGRSYGGSGARFSDDEQ